MATATIGALGYAVRALGPIRERGFGDGARRGDRPGHGEGCPIDDRAGEAGDRMDEMFQHLTPTATQADLWRRYALAVEQAVADRRRWVARLDSAASLGPAPVVAHLHLDELRKRLTALEEIAAAGHPVDDSFSMPQPADADSRTPMIIAARASSELEATSTRLRRIAGNPADGLGRHSRGAPGQSLFQSDDPDFRPGADPSS